MSCENCNCNCENVVCTINDTVSIESTAPIDVKQLTPNAKIPTRGSTVAAGYDLYADLKEKESLEIKPHTTVLVGTGLAMAIPYNTFLGIYPRSGLSSKKGLRPANCVGVVDSDYRGEIIVALHNDSNEIQTIQNGERIAQAIIQPYYAMNFQIRDELLDTDRGSKGFGSTGTM